MTASTSGELNKPTHKRPSLISNTSPEADGQRKPRLGVLLQHLCDIASQVPEFTLAAGLSIMRIKVRRIESRGGWCARYVGNAPGSRRTATPPEAATSSLFAEFSA